MLKWNEKNDNIKTQAAETLWKAKNVLHLGKTFQHNTLVIKTITKLETITTIPVNKKELRIVTIVYLRKLLFFSQCIKLWSLFYHKRASKKVWKRILLPTRIYWNIQNLFNSNNKKAISYKSQLNDGARFMASSLSNELIMIMSKRFWS